MPSYDDISLGAILVEAGLLKRKELDRGVRLLEALEKRGDPRQLHAVLAAEGLVDVRVLRRAITHLRSETLKCDSCKKETNAAELDLGSTFTCPGCSSVLTVPEMITNSEIDMVTVTLDEIRTEEDQASLVGKILGGVEIQSKLGQGGMGAVYKGVQVSLNRPVALKILPAELVRSRQYVQRFNREAQAVAALNHPNVVQIFETGKDEETHFIIMELVEGKSLGARLAESGTLPLPEALEVMVHSAKALDAAGKQSIVHRDIKPDNILITPDGVAKVADFGLAKSTEGGSSFTKTGQIMGTPAYMAPEQCEGKPADGRTDIYALGATFYHCLAGAPPFTGATPIAVLNMHVHEPLPPLGEVKPDVPPGVTRVIEKMLAKDPGDRHATAEDLVKDLERLQVGATQMLETHIQAAVAAPPWSPGGGAPPAKKKGKGKLVAGVAAVLALGAAGIFFAARSTGDKGKQSPPTLGETGTSIAGTPTTGTITAPPSGGLPPGTLQLLGPADGLVLRDYSVEVRGEVAADIKRVEVQGSSVSIEEGAFSQKVALTKGANEITVASIDGSGKRGETVLTILVDLDAPVLQIETPSDGFATPRDTVEVTGRATDPNLAEVTIDGAMVRVENGSFRGQVALKPGTNRIVVKVTDKAGNAETSRLTVLRDSAPPKIEVLEPAEGAWTKSPEIQLSIELTEEFPEDVTAGGVTLRPLGDGRWRTAVSLKEGKNSLLVVVTDKAGNRDEETRTIFLDTTAPVLEVTSPKTQVLKTREARLTLKGTAGDDFLADVRVGIRIVKDQPGDFESVVSLAEGDNTISVVARDKAGNEAAWEGKVFLDSTPPEISIDQTPEMPAGGTGKVTVRGRVNEAVKSVVVNGAPARLDGNEFNAAVAVRGGSSVLEIEARDLLGNVGRRTIEISSSMPAGLAAGEREGEFENVKDGAPMVLIEEGPFSMGSEDGAEFEGERMADEAPVHEVNLSAYLIDRHEVTNGQYGQFLQWFEESGDHSLCHPTEPAGHDHTPGYWDHKGWNRKNHPVAGVDWFDAFSYAAWAGKRLPTEAEWEKAARGTEGLRYPWGDSWDRRRCNSAARWVGKDLHTREEWKRTFQKQKPWEGKTLTLPVESIADGASPYGCMDMAGNVAEWTADWYGAGYYGEGPGDDPRGADSGEKRVARGGAWGFRSRLLRCADRGSLKPETRGLNIGFRCARDYPGQ